MLERAILMSFALMSAGCATTQSAGEPIAKPALALGQSPTADDPVMRIAEAINTVALLETAGEITAPDYLAGVRALRTSGARLDEDADAEMVAYETQWLAAARSLDPAATIPPLRGRALGPAYKRGTVPAGTQQVTTQLFLAGKKAKVALAGPGSSNGQSGLRLEIRQSDGDPVCVRHSGSASKGCEWIPLFSGRYEITVHNLGSSSQQYTLISN